MKDSITYDKEMYLFDLDNIIFPKRDYLVQVYYLFGSFYEFTEGKATANEIAQFMSKIYDHHGEEHVFGATKIMFDIDDKYEENFNRLLANAQLPMKLEVIPHFNELLLNLTENNKKIAILTKGNPIEQLNKIRFIDWESINLKKESLKIYFVDELEFRSLDPIEFIATEHGMESNQINYINQL